MRGWHQFWQGWNKFWQTPVGTALAIVLFVAATVLAFACPAFLPYYLTAVGGLVISLGVGAAINGFRSMSGGGDFWEGFANYLNEHWAQDVAIGMALAMVSFGIRQAAQAISSAAAERSLANAVEPNDGLGDLDWDSIVSDGETRYEHVMKHTVPNPNKSIHTLFKGDPITITNKAWRRRGTAVIEAKDGLFMYYIPYSNAGIGGLNGVKIVTLANTNKLISSYPVLL